MITLKEVLRLHELSIENFGGSNGVRDWNMLESALARPFQTFGGKDLYPSIYEKAAAIGESLIINHPFIDGNKRTGFLAMFTLLKKGNVDLIASHEEAYSFVIDIATGSTTVESIVNCIKRNSQVSSS
jgi:death-on-curing protein